jgi:hypothetical protein
MRVLPGTVALRHRPRDALEVPTFSTVTWLENVVPPDAWAGGSVTAVTT